VGSNLALELEAAGHSVAVLDNFSSGGFKNLEGFRGYVRAGDIRDYAAFAGFAGRFDAVFHEAAITDTTVMDQRLMMEVNVEGFRNALAFARERGAKRVVYASSAGVYGNGKCPMEETSVPAPENVYSFSKAVMDNVAREFAAANPKMTLAGLRYFNVYGPREGYKGKFASMIYQLYLQMKSGKRPRVFHPGEQSRDFIYIKDVAAANLAALKVKKSCVINAGTGRPETFNRVISCLNRALKTGLEPEYFKNPYSFYQNKTQAATALAKKTSGFAARWSLDEGIADYAKFLEGGR